MIATHKPTVVFGIATAISFLLLSACGNRAQYAPTERSGSGFILDPSTTTTTSPSGTTKPATINKIVVVGDQPISNRIIHTSSRPQNTESQNFILEKVEAGNYSQNGQAGEDILFYLPNPKSISKVPAIGGATDIQGYFSVTPGIIGSDKKVSERQREKRLYNDLYAFTEDVESETTEPYYPNGKLKIEYLEENGITTGTATRYYPNGDVKEIVTYGADGDISKTESFEQKEKTLEVEAVREVPDGLSGSSKDKKFKSNGFNKIYNSDDELWMDGSFKDSKLWSGKLYKYDDNGILYKIEIWIDGEYYSQTTLDNSAYSDYIGKIDQRKIDELGTEYERYNPFTENEWVASAKEAKSTFGIDVDNASYTNFRRFITNDQLPPKDAIRMEEWINYFNYEFEAPSPGSEHPLKVTSELAPCPWEVDDELLMVKLKGAVLADEVLPPSNLVFLVDVSGSMKAENKLPLVKNSMLKLVEKLRPQDQMSIVTYSDSIKVPLETTSGANKSEIIAVIKELCASGSTNGSDGIQTAYREAQKNFLADGNNRVILATDGDWNLGVTDDNELKKMIEEKRESGVFISVLGYGMQNLNDQMMELIADNGNGNYAYVDSEQESERLFDTEFAGSMYVIAKDVKLQVEFDSTVVDEYRLIGYENRVLENWQFEADSIDAGDLGMGQNVIAFYQIKRKNNAAGNVGKLNFRYKPLDSDVSQLLTHEFSEKTEESSSDFKYSSCVVEFALCLRESEHRGDADMLKAILRGRQNLGPESSKLGYDKRVEFVGLMEPTAEMYELYIGEEAEELNDSIVTEPIEEDTTTAVADLLPKLKLFPNPASESTTVEISDQWSEMWSVQVFNEEGRLMDVHHFRQTRRGVISVQDLEAGTYILKVYSAGFHHGYLRLVVT